MNMNILIIPSWYMTSNDKTRGSFFREHAIMLAQKTGVKVIVAYVEIHSAGSIIKHKCDRFDDNGIDTWIMHIHSYGYAKNKSLFMRIMYFYYKKLYDSIICSGVTPDIIHAHSFMPAGYVACKLGKHYGLPVVTTEHSSKVHLCQLSHSENKIFQYVINNSSQFICVSESLKRSVLRINSKATVKVIPNNLCSIFDYKNCKEADKFVFVSIGNLIESKRHIFLINCFKKAFKDKNIYLHIVGKGILESDIKREIERLNLKDQVILEGSLSRLEVNDILNKSHVFVLPSTNETFGVVYIEAIACGCPVIATRNGGAEEIVENQNGILIAVDSEAELIQALNDMYHSYSNYNLENISNNCKRRFGDDTIAKKTIKVYNELLRRK